MKILSQKEAEKAFNSTIDDADKMLKNPDKVEEFLQKLEKKTAMFPKFGKQISHIPVFISLIRSYIKKEYTEIPAGSIAAALCALIYFFAIADFIPDIIPFAGYIDDIGVIAFALKLIDSDIEEYIKFRDKQ